MSTDAEHFGRRIATADETRQIMKLGVWYDTVEDTLFNLGLPQNRTEGQKGFLAYDTDGRLVGVAYYDAAYQDGQLDKSKFGLREVAQLCNYYGSIWATWDPKAPPFEDYLGSFAASLRHVLQSTDGEDNGVELFNPVQKWRVPTNWKIPAFSSSTDPTHAAMTHRSVNAAAVGPQYPLR